MTTTSTQSSDLRIGEKIKSALRRNYRVAVKKQQPKTLSQQEQLAVSIVVSLDPMDRLCLSSPTEEERLNKMINYMIR